MGVKSLIRPAGKLYDEDFSEWARETARLLREGNFDDIDIEHLAEEIEDMAKRDKRELLSRLTVLILHLLKWEHQPKKRSAGWESTIMAQRDAIEDLLEQSPSLRRVLPESLPRVYQRAVQRASVETAKPVSAFPGECPFSVGQLLAREFVPGR